MPSFNDFDLQQTTLTMLTNMNIIEPTPIQAEAIPVLLAGKDLVGQSATGSGKTLAYGIPLVERLARNKREAQALVLVPTRELATQVNTVLSKLAGSRRLTTALLVGGRPYNTQISALRYGAQIVVGTPGRVKDHLDRGTLTLNQLRICVLDEADQMLDIGFAPIIEEILTTTPDTRQMALFSATIPDWIEKLEEKFLKDPIKVDITPATGAESTIEQIAYQIPHGQKMAALCTLLNSAEGESSLIFGKTKFGVEKLGVQLSKLGFTVGTLHGDKSQRARDEVLTAFRRGQIQTLLATNVAARGLDVKGIYQVINYELPESSDLFTHRIGRTGRMGEQGKAITLLVPSDLPKWRRMARSLGQAVTLRKLVIGEEPVMATLHVSDRQSDVATMPFARSEVAEMQEHEQRLARSRRSQDGEQRSSRSRRPQERETPNYAQQPVRSYRSQEREVQEQGQPPARSYRSQEHGKFARPKNDNHPVSGFKRQQRESAVREASVYIPESQPESSPLPARERPYASKPRDGRRATPKQTSFGRDTGKRKSRSITAIEPQRSSIRRKPSAPAARRTANRSASR